jgi:ABC-type transporter Mla subunit MlaD
VLKVKTVLLWATFVLFLAVTAGVSVGVYDAHRLLGNANGLVTDTRDTARLLNQTLAKVDAAADTLNAAAGEERENWKTTSKNTANTARDLRMLIARIDRSLVDGTLQHLNAETLPAIDNQIKANGEQLRATIAKAGGSADAVTAATNALNVRIADPQLTALLGHFNTVSGNLEVTSANFAAMTGDLRPAVHRYTAPPTRKQKILAGAKDFGGLIYLAIKIATLP